MKKFNVLYLVLALAFGTQIANAEVVNNYLEKFDNLKLTPTESFAPSKWGRIVDKLSPSGWNPIPDVYVSYTNPTTGGQDGAYLKAGSQDLTNDDYDTKTANDILVSPAVTGNVSFYAKSTASTGNIKIYVCTKSGDKYVKGTLYKEIAKAEISTTEWTKYTLPDVPANTFLGFRLDRVSIDEFSAASVDVVSKIALKIGTVTLTSPSSPMADTENKFTISYNVTITNYGDVALKPGDANYSVSIVNYSQSNTVVGTKDIDFTLEPGATSNPFAVSVTLDAGAKEIRQRYDIVENITKTTKPGQWITSMPYIAKFDFLTSANVSITNAINYGYIQGTPVAMDFKVKNSGAAPLNITGIALPNGFTSNLVTPLEIASGAEAPLTITLGIETEGNISGNIVFTTTQLGEKSYAINGSVIGANNWYENFEDGLPADMFFGDNWNISTFPKDVNLENNLQCIENSQVELNYAISPKLIIAEGESLAFNAAKISASSVINVYYSSDRSNWTKVKEIKVVSGSTVENVFSNETAGNEFGQFKFKQFIVNSIPAGEYYIAFESGYARIDDIFGYKKADVSHDFYQLQQIAPSTATVNNEYVASVTFKNLGKEEALGTYSVSLVVDDKIADNAEALIFPVGETKTFNLRYTPHTPVNSNAYFKVTAGEYTYQSPSFVINIAQEQNITKVVIGNKTTTSGNAPLSCNYKKSISETVYTASKLGFAKGANLCKIAYDGYCTVTKDVTNKIKVWIENTTDATPSTASPRDVAEMQLVYEGDVKIPVAGSSSSSFELLALQFTQNFTYTGDNIRIVISSEADNYKSVSFDVDGTVTDATIYRKSDSDISTASWSTSTMPVISIFEETEPVTYSGVVKAYETNKLLEGVSVVLTSGQVIYSTTTNISGEYNMAIYQKDKEYTLEVSYKDYKPINKTISFAQGSINENFILRLAVGVDNINGNKSEIIGGEGKIFVTVGSSTKVNVYTFSGICIHSETMSEGANVIDNIAPGFYIVNNKKIVVK
ncbi:MAG: carboxypeptidase-like regulatory domain-containing protein [Muribaculaceae bacterium]